MRYRHLKSQYGGRPYVVSYNVIIFCTQNGYFTISSSTFKFNFLDLVVSEIIGGVPNLHQGALHPPDAPSRKILTHPKVLAYTYIAVTFQLRSSILARLTESSYGVCTKKSPKIGFLGDFGGRGKDIWWESISILRIACFQTSLVQLPYKKSQENCAAGKHPFGPSTTTRKNRNHSAM